MIIALNQKLQKRTEIHQKKEEKAKCWNQKRQQHNQEQGGNYEVLQFQLP